MNLLKLSLIILLSGSCLAQIPVNPSGGGVPSGPCGGDLSGTFPNCTVTGSHINAGTIDTAIIGGTTPAAVSATILTVPNTGSSSVPVITFIGNGATSDSGWGMIDFHTGVLIQNNLGIMTWNHNNGNILTASSMWSCWNTQDNVTAGGADVCLGRSAANTLSLATARAGTTPATLISKISGIISSAETIASSATPAFTATTRASITTLTANITNFTLAAGTDGQEKTLTFCQNATGNFTISGTPANVHGFFTIGATASKCSSQHFTYYATPAAWLADSTGVINE